MTGGYGTRTPRLQIGSECPANQNLERSKLKPRRRTKLERSKLKRAGEETHRYDLGSREGLHRVGHIKSSALRRHRIGRDLDWYSPKRGD